MTDNTTEGGASGPVDITKSADDAHPADQPIVHESPRDREILLTVNDLVKHFPIKEYSGLFPKTLQTRAVDGVSFDLAKGETLGLVGESGCGKTTTGRLVTRLLDPTSGSIEFDGREIANLKERQLRPMRRDIQLIFQDPYGSLNPRFTVLKIIGAPLEIHGIVPKKQIKARVQELLEIVGLNPEHVNRYPNEFSGGQRQRIGIARALAVEPKVVVADEPVSALDVSIQAQVMNLMSQLRRDLGIAFVFIAHDLGIVRHFCDRVAVMYLGKIVELGDREDIYEKPQHPYTQALLSAAPDLNVVRGAVPNERIRLIGDVPSPIDPPSGCRFRTRCWKAQEICAAEEPLLEGAEGKPWSPPTLVPDAGSTSPAPSLSQPRGQAGLPRASVPLPVAQGAFVLQVTNQWWEPDSQMATSQTKIESVVSAPPPRGEKSGAAFLPGRRF